MRFRMQLLHVALPFAVGTVHPPATDLRIYRVEPCRSSVYVVTHKSSLFSFLGHEHAIVPMAWNADLCLSEPVGKGAHGTLRLQAASLAIDTDSARNVAGMDGGPSPDDRRQVQAKMLDSVHLDARHYPEIRITLAAAGRDAGGKIATHGTVALHGVTRDVAPSVAVRHGGSGDLVLEGVLRIRQRDFGITPESIAGVVKVSNDVDLHVSLAAVRTEARGAGE